MIQELVKYYFTKVGLYSNLLMILTAVHHIYGAIIYNTPWRLHILFYSIPMIIISYLFTRSVKKPAGKIHSVLAWVYRILILVVSIVLFGLYEGGYNHLVKVIIYYLGMGDQLFPHMYPPPPVFEKPNDFLFEFTGVLQVFITVPLIINFIRLTSTGLKKKVLAVKVLD